MSELHEATRRNDVERMNQLLSEGHATDLVDDRGLTALEFVVNHIRGDSHHDAFEVLLKNGAIVNPELFRTLVKTAGIKTVKLFLKFNDRLIDECKKPDTLLEAIRGGDYETVKLLVKHGSKVRSASKKDRSTPLHNAGRYCKHKKIVKYLLKRGASVDARDKKKLTPLAWMFHQEFRSGKILAFLLENSDVNSVKGLHRKKRFHLFKTSKGRKILLEHLAKLQSLEIKVNPVFNDVIRRHDLKNDNDKSNDYFESCKKELDEAKKTKLGDSWVTFFNLLVDDRRKLKNYSGNEDLVRVFEKSDCEQRFPIYGATMNKNMRKGIKRRELFDKSSGLLSDCLPKFNPTHLIIRDILDCVSTDNLMILCE